MNAIYKCLVDEKERGYKGGLYHLTQIKFAYNSNHIEGSKLTEDQTRYIYETNTILPNGNESISVNDITETVNHFALFDYMLVTAKDELTENFIKESHRFIKRGTSDERIKWFKVGDYKIMPNQVGLIETTAPEQVEHEIQKLLERYNAIQNKKLEDIVDFHFHFESIHPFQDGNGRVGRMIMFKECLQNDIVPFIITDELKAFYYRGLSEYQREKGYLLDTCLSAQDNYKQYLEYFKIFDTKQKNKEEYER